MGVLRDYWREIKRKDKELDRQLSPRFPHESLPNESYSQYKKRIKKESRKKAF